MRYGEILSNKNYEYALKYKVFLRQCIDCTLDLIPNAVNKK